MPLDFIETSDGTKIPALTRTDGAPASGTVEVPESVASFDNGSQVPVRVSATNPFPSYSLWGVLTAGVSLFDDGGSNPTIKSLANGALQISNAVDNTSGLYPWLDLELLVRGASSFTSGTTVDVWVLTSLDGTNYEDGGVSVTPGRPPDGYFFLRAVSTAQRLALTNIPLPPTKFKILLRNSGGQAFNATNGENALTYYRHGG